MSRSRAAAAAVLTAVLTAALAACGSAAAAPTVAGLPPCQPTGVAATTAAVDGLLLPDGAVVTSVTQQPPLQVVVAEVALTPVEVRAVYEGGLGELLSAEDEGFEAEVLYRDGDRRGYLRANATCDRGSSLLVVVAPESAATSLPAPSGSQTAP